MNILLLGNNGQLGWELNRTLLTLGDLIALDYPIIDMTNAENIRSAVRQHQPDLIVNATAYTAVNTAEIEPDLAIGINGIGPGVLAEEAKRLNSALIHYSTDYVFNGKKGKPYTEEDSPNPINVYGETKLAGEDAVQAVGGPHLIFRTSWVYSLRRPSFVTKVLQWARDNETLRIVDDQISNPTWARTLAEATSQVLAQGRKGIVDYIAENNGLYHLTDSGSCSRYEWAKSILELDPHKEEQIAKKIYTAKSIEFPTPAERPLHSTLSCEKFESTFKLMLPNWRFALALAMRI